jgi:hypothetical protein
MRKIRLFYLFGEAKELYDEVEFEDTKEARREFLDKLEFSGFDCSEAEDFTNKLKDEYFIPLNSEDIDEPNGITVEVTDN